MACTCTGNCDLINIDNLVLSDTFYTWYDRTNEIIDAINPLQVYDINVGITDGGLTMESTCVDGDTSGVYTLKVWPGPGIGVGTSVTPNYYLSHTMIDVSKMTIVGATGYADAVISNRNTNSFPSVNDWFIVSDTRDNSLGSGAGTPKRVRAEQILPPTVYLPPGFQFNGNVSINGNLSVQGTASNIDSNDLRIEDKLIEIAYHRLLSIDVTGPTYAGTFPAQGATFYYYDPGVTNLSAYTTVGQISQVDFGQFTGLKLHNFTFGGVNDIVAGGAISITGATFDFFMVAGPTVTEALFTDNDLDEAGLVVRGSQGNKEFIWVNTQGPNNDIYNSFVTNTNLGVSGDSNSIISSVFRSFGYGTNNTNNHKFHFVGESPSIRLGGLGTGNNQFGYWSITRQNYGLTTSQQPLVFGFKQHINSGETASFTIWSGASGPTYPNVTVSGQTGNRVKNFAELLNVDFLDGAHGTTMPTAWSIPIALADGTIDPGWIDNELEALDKCYTLSGHSFNVGDVVRLNPDTGTMTAAIATSRETAEVLGIVSGVSDANNFCIIANGFISNLTGPPGSNISDILPLVTGHAYFLSADDAGALILNPDSGAHQLELGEVRKPILVALGPDNGFIHNYLGAVEGEETDVIDVQGLVPVGTISPYMGLISAIPSGWLLCDGSRLEKSLWPELFAVIGELNAANAILILPEFDNDPTTITISGGHKGFVAGDAVVIEGWRSTGGPLLQDSVVLSVDDQTGDITVSGWIWSGTDWETIDSTNFRVRGRISSKTGETSVFLLPDIREKFLLGASKGTNFYNKLSLFPNAPVESTLDGQPFLTGIPVGYHGGDQLVVLKENEIPPHTHRLSRISIGATGSLSETVTIGGHFSSPAVSPATSAQINSGKDRYFTAQGPHNLGVGDLGAHSNVSEFVAVYWIIRARKGISAMILTGHNHDDRYIRHDGNQTGLTSTGRNQFRNNSKVLSNGHDGPDTFHSTLTVTGGIVVGVDNTSHLNVNSHALFAASTTFSSQFSITRNSGTIKSSVDNDRCGLQILSLPYFQNKNADLYIANGYSGQSYYDIANNIQFESIRNTFLNSAIKVHGGNDKQSSIVIFNDNANASEQNQAAIDEMSLQFWGNAQTGSNISPKLAGIIKGVIDTGLADPAGNITRKLVLQVGGVYSSSFNTPADVITIKHSTDTQGKIDLIFDIDKTIQNVDTSEPEKTYSLLINSVTGKLSKSEDQHGPQQIVARVECTPATGNPIASTVLKGASESINRNGLGDFTIKLKQNVIFNAGDFGVIFSGGGINKFFTVINKTKDSNNRQTLNFNCRNVNGNLVDPDNIWEVFITS
jgi:microcystin-dependent protein